MFGGWGGELDSVLVPQKTKRDLLGSFWGASLFCKPNGRAGSESSWRLRTVVAFGSMLLVKNIVPDVLI